MGLCKLQRQPSQDFQAYNQQVYQEDRFLMFDKYTKQQSNQSLQTAQISNDEMYLAIGRHKKIQIYYLKNKKILKYIIGQQKIQIIKFSNNSRYLLFGDVLGYLYCYDIYYNFQIILQIKNDDQILTSSHGGSLLITDIKKNQKLLKIKKAHTCWISGIDFDKSNDFIISCSSDCSIKFFNRKDGKCLIQQKKTQRYGIKMVQLISEDNNLISSNNTELILWHIDYKRLQLNKIKEFLTDYIQSFTSVLNNNKIVVISLQNVEILDKNLDLLQSVKHKIYTNHYFKNRQLNSLNYIIVPGQNNLIVFKKVGKKWK